MIERMRDALRELRYQNVRIGLDDTDVTADGEDVSIGVYMKPGGGWYVRVVPRGAKGYTLHCANEHDVLREASYLNLRRMVSA